MDCCRRDL
jgi:hypothetical protein